MNEISLTPTGIEPSFSLGSELQNTMTEPKKLMRVSPGQSTAAAHLNQLVDNAEYVKEILLSIVDALHDKDGDSATWKPIRDKIEAL